MSTASFLRSTLCLDRASSVVAIVTASPAVSLWSSMRRCFVALIVTMVCWQAPGVRAADLLLAGFDADKVLRYDGASGALVGVFAEHATLMDGPTALVYNPGGSLLVLNEFSHNVLEFNGTTGSFVGTLIDSSALGSVGVTDPNDMELGADGNLYVTSHFSTGGNIWRFNSTTGAFVDVFASTGSVDHTHGLAFGPDGNLYQGIINFSSGHTIRKFDGTTGADLGTFATQPAGPWADLTFGPTGTLYATLDGGGGTMRFDGTSGAFIGYIVPPGSSTWGLLSDSGSLYVGVTSTGTVKKFDAATGAFISDFITGAPVPFDLIPMAVPEPGSLGLLASGAGLALVAAARLRCRRRAGAR